MTPVPTHVEEVVERVCCIPLSLAFRGNRSLQLLVDETGYPCCEREIDEQQLRAGIRERAGLVETWLSYSKEKQENWGWFFEGPHKGTYLVGCRTSYTLPPRSFRDPFDACACFIKEEVDAIRGKRRLSWSTGGQGHRALAAPGGSAGK